MLGRVTTNWRVEIQKKKTPMEEVKNDKIALITSHLQEVRGQALARMTVHKLHTVHNT